MSEEPHNLPRVKARLPFEERPKTPGAGVRGMSFWVYGVLTAGLAGLALYMATIGGHPLTSPYVAAPAVGALWFGLRLFMLLAPRV